MPQPDLPLNLVAQDVSDRMIFRKQVASGQYQGMEFNVTSSLTGLAFYVEAGGEQWEISLNSEVIQKILENIHQRKKN